MKLIHTHTWRGSGCCHRGGVRFAYFSLYDDFNGVLFLYVLLGLVSFEYVSCAAEGKEGSRSIERGREQGITTAQPQRKPPPARVERALAGMAKKWEAGCEREIKKQRRFNRTGKETKTRAVHRKVMEISLLIWTWRDLNTRVDSGPAYLSLVPFVSSEYARAAPSRAPILPLVFIEGDERLLAST